MLLFLLNCSQTPTIEMALDFYEKQPTYLRPNSLSKTPMGLSDMRAETCGGCHQSIYQEWAISTHANAWQNDPQFQAELHKERADGGDVQWMCANCHTPTIQQLPRLVAGLQGGLDKPIYVDNPYFDKKFQHEGVSCAACHIRDGVILGPRGDSVAPHPVRKSQDLITSEVCLQCHQATASFESLNLACVFNTGQEHQEGDYRDQTCQSCHMPLVEREVVPMGKQRNTRRHFFGGSLIAKKFEYVDDIAKMTPYFNQGLEVDDPIIEITDAQVSILFRYRNANAGHHIPTGDPERFFLFTATISDQLGQIQWQEKMTIGAQYEWWPTVRLISDNRLKTKEERTWKINWQAKKQGMFRIDLLVEKWRISTKNLTYHQLENIMPSHSTIIENSFQVDVSSVGER